MGMKVSDFCVLAVPGTRTEWSEIKDRVDRAAVATPVRLLLEDGRSGGGETGKETSTPESPPRPRR